jgi:hypothetical protein
MFDGQAILEPPNPEPSVIEVNIIAAEADQLADAQAMTIHHEQKEMIPGSMPRRLWGVKQARDLGLIVVLVPSRMFHVANERPSRLTSKTRERENASPIQRERAARR